MIGCCSCAPAEFRFPAGESGRKIGSMSEHKAILHWASPNPEFVKGRFSRAHTWTFDGGVTVPASPAPAVVPAPWSDATAVDPEEAYVASIASCHMLTFLWLASRGGFAVAAYEDEAVGKMAKNERGVPWVAEVRLAPRVKWDGDRAPDAAQLEQLHHQAHEQCFIANSVKTAIVVAPPQA